MKRLHIIIIIISFLASFGNLSAITINKEKVYQDSGEEAKRIAIIDENNKNEILGRLKNVAQEIAIRSSEPVMIEISRPNHPKNEKSVVNQFELNKIESYLDHLKFGLVTFEDAYCFIDFKLQNGKVVYSLYIKVDLDKRTVKFPEPGTLPR